MKTSPKLNKTLLGTGLVLAFTALTTTMVLTILPANGAHFPPAVTLDFEAFANNTQPAAQQHLKMSEEMKVSLNK
ncbi:hypothetical protein [Undibacterium sp. TJN19]|uniref:hypothetical protein n=1 Tax=Undibacterium sp. TJN19 TaxID=3413055 RepID=UPI003BF066D7